MAQTLGRVLVHLDERPSNVRRRDVESELIQFLRKHRAEYHKRYVWR
jgi:hypothetical protein